jgi:hypothetical protein
MSFDEFFFRLRERLSSLINSESRFTKIFSRLVALSIFAFVISTIAPTLADELSGSPALLEPTPNASADPMISTSVETPTVSDTPSALEEPNISRPQHQINSPTPLAESTDSPTAATLPALPLVVQPTYTLRIPSSVALDPRAKSYLLPHIYASTGNDRQYTMVCITGAGINFDALAKQSAQNSPDGPDFVTGDRSAALIISGENNRVVNLVNSYGGLIAYSPSTGIAGRTISWNFVALTRPSTDPSFCSASLSRRQTVLRPLELEESTVKGSGTLK